MLQIFVWSMFSISLMSQIFYSQSFPTVDWFGPNNQFKCRSDYFCYKDGSSPNRCMKSWFGYKCQYADLMKFATLETFPWTYDTYYLTDGDDRTCRENIGLLSAKINFNQVFPFSWMRLIVKSSISTDMLTKILVSLKKNNESVTCKSLKMTTVDIRSTIDVKCLENVHIDAILLEGDIVKYLCSIYVSGGRNIAIRGITSSSSGLTKDDHIRAVDGNTLSDFNKQSCTHSKTTDKTPTWTLTLNEPVFIDRIVLYNRGGCCGNRLAKFQLMTRNKNGEINFIYPGPNVIQPNYSVLFSDKLEINMLTIQASAVVEGGNNVTILSLCEVEVYGDCQPSKWGLSCDNDCDTNCPNYCNVQDGKCDTSCLGYEDPPDCTKQCNSGKWGINCSNACSSKCYQSSCDAFSGYCDQGCLGFDDPPYCTLSCVSGKYGHNCETSCPANCKGNTCTSANGECLECEVGYAGTLCENECPLGWWGKNCSERCATKCYQTCNHKYGICDMGCLGYSDPPDCKTECKSGFHGKNCTSTCSVNCVDSLCNASTGRCLKCIQGYTGYTCSNEKQSFEDGQGNSVIIYPIVFLTIIIAVLLTVIIIVRRKRQQAREEDERAAFRKTDGKQTKLSINSKDVDIESENKANTDLECTYLNQKDVSLAVKDTSIPVDDLFSFIASHDSKFFKAQFQAAPVPQGVSLFVGQSPENKSKNRYKNISPYDHNRVHLQINTSKSESDYINASYVNGFNNDEKFIASQGPHKTILNDFIRMLWEQRIEKVVMLTSLAENGKLKCEQYWPDKGSVRFGDIKVKLKSVETFADYTIRIIELTQKGQLHTFTQFHYLAWPDKDIPQNPWSLAEFQYRVSLSQTSSPILVHCSAGAGRTGSYIALHNLIQQAEYTCEVDFFQTLTKLRQDRMCMIQTAEQYQFVHTAVLVILTCLGHYLTPVDFMESFETLNELLRVERTKLDFNNLVVISEFLHRSTIISEASDGHNVDVYLNTREAGGDSQNRFSSMLPKDIYRPFLSKDSNDTGDYINAILVQSLRAKNQHILTQLPLPTTVVDFWRLVVQYKVNLIVAFEADQMQQDSSIGKYLPTEQPLKVSHAEIYSSEIQNSNLWEEQKLLVKTDRVAFLPETSTVIHLKCLVTDRYDWNKMLSFMKQVKSYDAMEGRIIFMCKNGATYSGLACVVYLLLECLEQNSWFNIPNVVGEVKSIRPQVIASLNEYLLVHKILQRYIELSSQYHNVSNEFLQRNQDSVKQESLTEDRDEDVYANM